MPVGNDGRDSVTLGGTRGATPATSVVDPIAWPAGSAGCDNDAVAHASVNSRTTEPVTRKIISEVVLNG